MQRKTQAPHVVDPKYRPQHNIITRTFPPTENPYLTVSPSSCVTSFLPESLACLADAYILHSGVKCLNHQLLAFQRFLYSNDD